MKDLQYPIGRYAPLAVVDEQQRRVWIQEIGALPGELSAAVADLFEEQLDTPYREGGWTIRQVAHHVADSHMNAYMRFRLALTEDVPLIKAYDEKLWAELPDAKSLPVAVSLQLLTGLHERWTMLLTEMTEADFRRKLRHPEAGEMDLNRMLGLYAWHGRHHTAQILNSFETAAG